MVDAIGGDLERAAVGLDRPMCLAGCSGSSWGRVRRWSTLTSRIRPRRSPPRWRQSEAAAASWSLAAVEIAIRKNGSRWASRRHATRMWYCQTTIHGLKTRCHPGAADHWGARGCAPRWSGHRSDRRRRPALGDQPRAPIGGRDVVAILGKGHEVGQEIAGTVLPFSDPVVAAEEWAVLHPNLVRQTGPRDPMIAVTVDEIATVLGAQLSGPGDTTAVVIALTADSRAVSAGALFVALRGEHVDGHDYVARPQPPEAAALTRHPVKGALCVVVVDPLVALGRISRYLVDRASAGGLQVVGITGSVGKTSTKDCSRRCSSAPVRPWRQSAISTTSSVPLTVGDVDKQTRCLVAEMGRVGLATSLTSVTSRHHVGVVLNVGRPTWGVRRTGRNRPRQG